MCYELCDRVTVSLALYYNHIIEEQFQILLHMMETADPDQGPNQMEEMAESHVQGK